MRLTPPICTFALASALALGIFVESGCGANDSAEPGPAAAAVAPDPPGATPEAGAEMADSSAAGQGEAGSEDTAVAAGVSGKLLRWLDPEAVGATWIGGAHDLDAEALTTLYAIPPRAARMLRDAEFVDEGLAIIFGAEGVTKMLRPEVLAMQPAVARGTYVLRLLRAPRAEVEAALTDYEMEKSTIEGYALWEPSGAFPWRILVLDGETIAVIPKLEMGSGIGPLTAARDLPPSALEGELQKAIAGDPDLILDLFAEGPFLHMDLSADVAVVRLSLRRWRGSGIDSTVLLQPLEDPAKAALELEDRDGAGETDAMRGLIDRIAFSAEPPVVIGRLQILAEDRGPLRRSL